MGKNAAVPATDVIGSYSERAAGTARSHLRAAKCLLYGGFWGQAHSFAVIAFEEAGKAWLSLVVTLSPHALRQELQAAAADHLGKLGAAHWMRVLHSFVRDGTGSAGSGAEALAGLDALCREDNRAKQRGLYTDYVNGAVHSPADITEQQARNMVAVVEDVLDNAGPLVDLVTALWARDNLPFPVLSILRQAVDAVRADGDPTAILTQAGLQGTEHLAGMIRDNPEWMSGILTIAQQLHGPESQVR